MSNIVLFFLFLIQKNITPELLNNLISQNTLKNTVILDVRTKSEVDESYIPNSININFYDNNFDSAISMLDKELTYYVYCRSGNRSSQTVEKLKSLGFEKAFNLEGGIALWKEKGFRTKKKRLILAPLFR